ncbi:MAG TPA: CCA tRNA nucleotidyltransferase [Methylocella sp.]|nr:CCA tRNA nucleotidyltransferase [Methylocella sp.]
MSPRAASAAPVILLSLFEDRALSQVFAALADTREETRIVGGALRDRLFGRASREIDIATTLAPEAVIGRVEAAGLRAIPTGIVHGTVTVLCGGQTFEVTTLREDIATDGRRAEVRFGRDFELDALRRDFTMNALSMTPDGELFDYTGGLADIMARRVRFIGEPERRIKEDYLRILRFFRFSADFGEGPLDKEGHRAAIRQRDGLSRLSRERIRGELLKILCTRRAGDICEELCADGLLHLLLGLAPYPERLRRAIAIEDGPPDAILRLAALCVTVPEHADELRDRLRLSNGEAGRLAGAARALVELHGRGTPAESRELLSLLYRHGRMAAADALTLAQADAPKDAASAFRRARHFMQDAPEPRMPFTGGDLLRRGFPNGRAIGEALKELEARWIRTGFPQDEAALARILDDILQAPK